jgi:hypothetical protein
VRGRLVEVIDRVHELVICDVVALAAGDARIVEHERTRCHIADDYEVVGDGPGRLLVVSSIAGVISVPQAVRSHADDERPPQGELLLHVEPAGLEHLVGPAKM